MNFNLYLEQGIVNIAAALSNFYLTEGIENDFITSIVPSLVASTELRREQEKGGLHIPPFLIASIASKCNLHCAGCYARAGGICAEHPSGEELSAEEWRKVLKEASALGVSFVLLAGGEPLLRQDIISIAAEFPAMIFPIFTNGTLFDEKYYDMFSEHRSLIPVFSIEGGAEETDSRRGKGVSENVKRAMEELCGRGVMFAASVTVTNRNLPDVVSENYLKELRSKGCGVVFFVEYVPAEKGTEGLVLSQIEEEDLNRKVAELKSRFPDVNIFSFPGDEKNMGGCLAAGRGFFHINPFGGAEPCPFSPFSKLNVRENSIIEILKSPFFEKVRQVSMDSAGEHSGGCTLFSHEDEIRQLI